MRIPVPRKNRGISPTDTACYAERRAFLKALTTTTAALAVGGCGGPTMSGSTSSSPAANLPPVWQTVTAVAFTQGVPSSVSIAAYVSDPDGDALTITMTSGTLPAGVTFDAAGKRFVYDGVGPLGSTSGVVLTANDGRP